MGPRKVDIAAVKLPEPFVEALRRLVAGTVVPSKDPEDADKVLSALFGTDAVTFGRVHRIDAPGLKDALAAAGIDAPVARIRELVELLRLVTPDAPICGTCGEFPFSNVGGKVSVLAEGAHCPFCASGAVGLVPMTLRMLAWTDGRLVEPNTAFDLRSRPGERIPLLDDDIVRWAGRPRSDLARALKSRGVPVYGFLAYARLARQVLTDIADTPALLGRPDDFGLVSPEKIEEVAAAAAAYLAEREVTNMPTVSRYVAMKGLESAPQVSFGGQMFVLEGLVAKGSSCDVFRACTAGPFPELVIVKIARDANDCGRIAREVAVLREMAKSEKPAAEYFVRMVPEVTVTGTCVGEDGIARPAVAMHRKIGYEWSLDDVRGEYPDGVDGKTVVWMWKRVLMLIAWAHRNGFAHCAVVPEHVIVHALAHSATLVDWSHTTRLGANVAPTGIANGFIPDTLAGKASIALDIAMSARTMIAAIGGDPETGAIDAVIPERIADFLRAQAAYGGTVPRGEAYPLHERFGELAESVYGPKKYHPFVLPRP